MANAIGLVVSILICEAAGGIGGFFTSRSVVQWYPSLIKPSFTPPSWIFMPVWTTLYFFMGVSAFLIWRIGWQQVNVRWALAIFTLQLLLNILWSIAFFGLRSPLAGFVVIILLWLAIFFTIVSFWRLSSISALLLFPYILWVSFAAILNAAIFYLNLPKN